MDLVAVHSAKRRLKGTSWWLDPVYTDIAMLVFLARFRKIPAKTADIRNGLMPFGTKQFLNFGQC
jgi:hypothetical protein